METVWAFETARFRVQLGIEQLAYYEYDGDDEDGETQAALDSGEFVAFDSTVRVFLDGREVGSDALGSSVYAANDMADFWTAHRDRDPMNRNCSIMRAAHPAGPNVAICHYFPGMVRHAVAEARRLLSNFPELRAA